MFDVLMTLDLHHALLIGHVMAMIMGLGIAMSVEFILLRSLLSKRTSSTVLDLVKQGGQLVACGVLLMWVTGVALLLYNRLYGEGEVILNAVIYAKIVIAAVLTINGGFIYSVIFPILRKYSGRHVLANASQNETLLFAICGGTSVVSWIFPVLMSFNPALNTGYSAANLLGQYFFVLTFVVMLFCACALKLRERSRAASLLSYHGKAVASAR